jgi:predicted NAD-dependent protein-ADP-ribosyltransferase YbiA (DUF1768 family)
MESPKICILTSSGEISHTIYFSGHIEEEKEGSYTSEYIIHPDDSVRTIKMKLLYELHQGRNANRIQLRPSYEELYLYGFVREETSSLQLFNILKTSENENNPMVSLDTIRQIVEGHPDAKSILEKLTEGDKILYRDFESVLSEKKIIISVKTPIGILFERDMRDTTFEVDPFSVEKYKAYLAEHNTIHYLDDSLLLNYGNLTQNTIYLCLADRAYESSTPNSEEYIARYYFPGLYKNGIKSKETLIERRGKLITATNKLITEERLQYYKSIEMFYKIAEDDRNRLEYVSQGIQKISLSLKSHGIRRENLGEMLFKNMHCSKDIPYIKFNPGNRRENLYRFYFERTTRTGKKIPYLPKSQIMKMARETGKGRQISLYLEGALSSDMNGRSVLSNCYVHFEPDGDIQLQLVFNFPVTERIIDDTIRDKIVPYLLKIGRDIKQTGFVMPVYNGLRHITTKVVDATFVSKAHAIKPATWESVPCIYSICTLNTEMPGQPLVARLKRVDNFREMDAANILIAELYGQVQYGDMILQDIVDELVTRGLSENEDAAKISISSFLSSVNEMNGNIVEKPGFPIEMNIDSAEKTVEINISGLTSVYYLDTVGIYIDAILKTTQIYKESNPLIKQLKTYCKKANKFKEVEVEPELVPVLENVTRQEGPMKRLMEDDFFAQFETDDEEDESEYVSSENIFADKKEDDNDAENLLEKLHKNTREVKPHLFDESESEPEQEPESKKELVRTKPGPMLFDESESESESESVQESSLKKPEENKVHIPVVPNPDSVSEEEEYKEDIKPTSPTLSPIKSTPNIKPYDKFLQFHSKSALMKGNEFKPLLDQGLPETAMRDLSNFANFSVEYNGKVYPTVEHAFQSQKYLYATYSEPKSKKTKKNEIIATTQKESLEDIMNRFTVDGELTALQAKTEGGRKTMEERGYTLDISRWATHSVPLMQELIQSKIERNPEIKQILNILKQFNVQLAHFSRSDMKWGCHVSEDGKTIKNGSNKLGEIYNQIMYDSNLPSANPEPEPNPVPVPVPEPVPVPVNAPEPVKVQTKGPIMFDSDEEDEDGEYDGGGEEDEEENSNEDEEGEEGDIKGLVPDGLPLKSLILKRLQRRDPVIFTSKKTPGIYKSFSTSCQPTTRHPIILTKDEYERTDKDAYENVIKYGSDPNNQHYFICPRFWCLLTNSAISAKDAKSGKCGEIIPKNAEVVPKGAYVYELNGDDNDQYPFPGFMENTRADGKCLPCCFKNWSGKKQKEARERCEGQMNVASDATTAAEEDTGKKKKTAKKPHIKTLQYIISLDTYPVPQERWGFLPIPVQLFFQMDYRPALDPNNPALLQPKKPVFLRQGVEQPLNQSFLGCFANIYAHRHGLDEVPSVDNFRVIMRELINLDVFVRAHNGSLLSVFYPKNANTIKRTQMKEMSKKYKDTEFALSLDLQDKAKLQHLNDAILSYENFIAYLSDSNATIDHQYLWDFVCENNPRFIPNGLNLVILEIRANDIIDRIEMVCPTNLHSRHQFDSAKDTVILLKHDSIYEPIYMYESGEGNSAPKVTRFLSSTNVPSTVVDMLKRIEHTTRKYCPGLPSLPRIYRFAEPVNIRTILMAMVKIGAKIVSQVSNYEGKTIGLMVLEKDLTDKTEAIYVPCAPSARQIGISVKYMDSLDIPKEYEKTTASLNRISISAKIPCKPVWKIKEDGLIVGFLTETNQFVPIKPNEDIIVDGLHAYEGVNTFEADKIVATENSGDKKRIKTIKYIKLESQFYYAFRNRIRILINQFINSKLKNEIRQIADDKTIIYSQKVEQIEPLIKTLIRGYVDFAEIDEPTLLDLADINCYDIEDDDGPSCIIKNGKQMVIPYLNLISNHDNEKIYIGRVSDELVRNERVKSVMYDIENRLNAKTIDYQIRDDEFILVQSALTTEYFSELESHRETTPYAANTNYELASPSISVVYPNEKIPLSEQQKPEVRNVNMTSDNARECLDRISKIIGNKKQVWDRIFSDDAREHIFRNTANCTFQPIIHVIESKLGETWTESNIKTRLATSYLKLFDRNPSNLLKIAKILREQGKSRMFERITTPESFQNVVINNGYYLTDMDIWVLANEYNLPIIVFNANGLKGFFAESTDTNTQWIKMGGDKNDKYHFIRSKIRVAKGSYANYISEYNLIVPEVKLSQTKEFGEMVVQSYKLNLLNTCKLEDALEKFL